MSSIEQILLTKYSKELVETLLNSYKDLKDNFFLGNYKPSELEGGFFVEATRRIIEFELTNTIIPPSTQLSNFNDQEMRKYEQATGDDTFRFHIPRVLKAIYNIRNKRGVGHVAGVIPNVIDSTLIVSCCDWILAELVRINSTLPYDECERLIDSIVERKISIVFDTGKVKRVLDTSLPTTKQVLVLLHHSNGEVDADVLRSWIEYKNASRFRTEILQDLHKKRFIEFDGVTCLMTPKGIKEVEENILKQGAN
ncbi:MAG: hypothetical protein HY865_17610 [Chloroflexi bacterium]|nr:hypothetical protein [Chloroflexota bacterium]